MALLRKPGGKLARYEGKILRDVNDTDCCCSQFCCEGELQCQGAVETFVSQEPCMDPPRSNLYGAYVDFSWNKEIAGTCSFQWNIIPPSSGFVDGANAVVRGLTNCSDAEGAYVFGSGDTTHPATKTFLALLPPISYCDWENATVTVEITGQNGVKFTVAGVQNSWDAATAAQCPYCDTINGVYLVECGDSALDPPDMKG